MRRRLLSLLFLPGAILYPLYLYLQFVPAVKSGFDVKEDAQGRALVAHVDQGTSVAQAGLRVGDVLISMDGIPRSLNAATTAHYFRAAEDARHVLEIERDGRRQELAFQRSRFLSPGEIPSRLVGLLQGFLCLITGLLLWFAGKGSAQAEYAGAFFIFMGEGGFDPTTWGSLGPLLQKYPAHIGQVSFVLFAMTVPVAMALLVTFVGLLPRPRATGWKFLLGAVTTVWSLLGGTWATLMIHGDPPEWFWLVNGVGWTVGFMLYTAAALTLLFLNFRAATDVNDRRRMRILMAGFACAVLAQMVEIVVMRLPARLIFLGFVPMTLLYCVPPAAVAYALLKHRLFDVRVIVRQGLQYAFAKGSLMALIVIPLAGLVVHFYQSRGQRLGDVLSTNAVVYLVVGISLLAILAKRRDILRSLDRRFFRDAYDPREIHLEIARLLAKRENFERDSRHLTGVLVHAFHSGYGGLLIRSKSTGVFRTSLLLVGETGETPFPAREMTDMPASSRLPALLELTGKPLEVDLADRRSFLRQLPQEDQNLVQTWKAGVLAPVGERTVEALLVLGEKLSEQPYSAEDIKLLEAVSLDFTAAYFSRAEDRHRSGERMKECPRCGACCSEDTENCPSDGSALIETTLSMAVAGRFHLHRRLGAGGMGVVYLANDKELERQVAVKVIRPDSLAHENALDRFRREARSAASLSHPNVVAVFDFGKLHGGGAYLVMEYLEGKTLRQLLRSETALAPAELLQILDGVVAALESAHQRGLVHRDLKPENVMVLRDSSGSSRIKVLDFGLAKNIDSDEETLTQTGQVPGTLAYMAPEQLQGGNIDARTDLYALAVMTHELLTGSRPSQGRITDALWRPVLERGLARRPADRYRTVTEFFEQLKQAITT